MLANCNSNRSEKKKRKYSNLQKTSGGFKNIVIYQIEKSLYRVHYIRKFHIKVIVFLIQQPCKVHIINNELI